MKRIAFIFLGLFLFIGGLSLGYSAKANNLPPAQQKTLKRHPHIAKGIKLLEQAHQVLSLESGAEDDFGGHRAKAMEDVKVGIVELHAALQYVQEHEQTKKKP